MRCQPSQIQSFASSRAVNASRINVFAANKKKTIIGRCASTTSRRESLSSGGTTPPHHQLIDAIGARGRVVGDAQMSDLHANFMINRGAATAADLEALGEGIRRDVKDRFGVELEWEIKRVGDPQ